MSNSGYTYDASGDLTSDGVHTYQYDAEGRLISVDNGSTASYVYNALGERVEKDVAGTYTEYLFDKDDNPIGENNRSGWTDTWVIFNGQHVAHYQNGETYFMHANNVGTTAFVTDYTGAVIQDETHYPWGQEWAMQGTMEEERFASLQHRDSETALDPTHFRMYNSGQGRWQSPDPVRSCPFHPENFDRYPYASNNPRNRIDPIGDACYPVAYDEFDYLEEFGFVPDYPPYSCPGTTSCSYYRSQCDNPRIPAAYKFYYCVLAPPVCQHTINVPYTDCVRLCLQTRDTCWEKGSTGSFYACIGEIHAQCFAQCTVCNFAPVLF